MEGSNESIRVQTARAALASYSALEVEALLQPLDDEFTHKVLPSSLEMPLRNREAFTTHADRVTSVFKSFSMVPQSMFEDPVKNTVIVYAKMIGELVDLGPWENECIIFMKMSANGKKVVEHTEFVDSLRAKLLQAKLMGRTKINLMMDDVDMKVPGAWNDENERVGN
ncbi:hypothetical protein N431DRAFT_463988 [Stipitochalara longipes BDJ]|nr:hypothetical protein N431DRAFT_463988 [Stipitochalara longipes BDJ]